MSSLILSMLSSGKLSNDTISGKFDIDLSVKVAMPGYVNVNIDVVLPVVAIAN